MTDEELERLKAELTEQLEQLSGDAKSLSKEDRKNKLLMKAKVRALERIKEAREKGTPRQELKASMDYAVLKEYGHRNWIIYNLAKSRFTLLGF